jgi:hypothetical protein
MTMRYRFLVVNVLAALALMPCISQAVGENTVPYTNTFESYAEGYLITNAPGWHSDNSYTFASISNETDHGLISPYLPQATPHTKVLNLSGTISNVFSANTQNYVYIDMLVFPEGMDHPQNLPDGCQIVAYVNTNSHLVFLHSVFTGVDYVSRWATNDVDTVQTGQWNRLTFTMAYRESPSYFDAYFSVQVNGGSPFSDPNYGYGQPADNDIIDGGPWFLTANSASYSFGTTNGFFSGLIIDGIARLDDMVISDVEPPTGAATTTTNGTPIPWLAAYYPAVDPDVADWSDTDGDGMFAWQEYQAGTIPTDPASVFRITTVGSDWSITWLGRTNEENINYRVYRGTSMMDGGAWTIVTNVVRSPSGVNLWTDGEKDALSPGAYFYKIVAPAAP